MRGKRVETRKDECNVKRQERLIDEVSKVNSEF